MVTTIVARHYLTFTSRKSRPIVTLRNCRLFEREEGELNSHCLFLLTERNAETGFYQNWPSFKCFSNRKEIELPI